jgi:hypothetical protein
MVTTSLITLLLFSTVFNKGSGLAAGPDLQPSFQLPSCDHRESSVLSPLPALDSSVQLRTGDLLRGGGARHSRPVVFPSQRSAQEACERLGKRLPTLLEVMEVAKHRGALGAFLPRLPFWDQQETESLALSNQLSREGFMVIYADHPTRFIYNPSCYERPRRGRAHRLPVIWTSSVAQHDLQGRPTSYHVFDEETGYLALENAEDSILETNAYCL